MRSGSLLNYYKDKIDDVDGNVSDCKSFKYMTKITRKTEARHPRQALPPLNLDGSEPPQPPIPPLNTEVTIPSKYLSNFWRCL